MKPFSLVLMVLWATLAIYTALVVQEYGLNLFPYFFGDVAAVNWPGQFNLDFMLMLVLSASWEAWRNRFSAVGFALSVFAFFGGAGFLLPYITYLTWKHDRDISAILLGSKFPGGHIS